MVAGRKSFMSKNEIVGTQINPSRPISSAWLRRNVFQPCEGGLLFLAIILGHVSMTILMPSLSSLADKNHERYMVRIVCRAITSSALGRTATRRQWGSRNSQVQNYHQ